MDIEAQIQACTRCDLHRGRTQVVPGQGPPNARIALVGEGPGEDEDRTGLAFVGPAGKLLTRMLKDAGLGRERVWIGNIIKCRPPNNRDPHPAEVAACKPFLRAQIQEMRPKVIVTLGKYAAWHMTGIYGPISLIVPMDNLQHDGIPVIACYHPAFLLRKLSTKHEARPLYLDFVDRLKRAREIAGL